MELYIAVLAGCLIYVLLQLNQNLNNPEFSWKIYFKTNVIPTALNLIIGCILVYAKDDLTTIYPITFVSAMMLGVSGQALIKKLSNIFDSKVNTLINI